MQVIQITSLTGHSPYDITICDITNTYCYSGVTGATSVPLTIDLPTELLNTTEILVVVTDSIGCEEIQYHQCTIPPTPTPTPTVTPTITPTNPICNCISIENPSGVTLNFTYTQCDGTSFFGPIYSSTTLFVCGSLASGDTGLIITNTSNVCVNDECPGPTPTPTTTPTPTPTLPPIVGYFQDGCDSSYEFTLSDIPISFSPLSGVYYIESSGYVGCATSITSTTSTNIFSFVAMGSQPNLYHCQKANFIYPCPTLTPTPSITPTLTPTPTVTMTVTPTTTMTPTPTTSMLYNRFRVLNCCDAEEGLKNIKFMSLPSYFLPGTSVVDNSGNCWRILSTSTITPNEYWNHGATYPDCELCIKYQTCTPTISSFISVWVTTTSNESIMLPYETTGSYSGTINWGDGNISVNSYANRAHTYTTPGTYTITINGTLIGWSFFVNPISRLKIYEVLQWGCLRLGNSSGYFYLCTNLTLSNVVDVLDLTGTNNLSLIFAACPITTIQNVNSWNTSGITNMYGVFNSCTNFDDNIGSWNVSNVTDMSQMFESCNLFNNGGSPSINNWNTSNLTNMYEMFFDSTSFNQPLSGWNVSNVTNMYFTFGASGFDQPINNWDVGNVTTMEGMFSQTPFNQPLSGWNVSNVTNMSAMFLSTSNFDQPINNWDVSNVTNMSFMFDSTVFNQPLSGWNVVNVTTMQEMFQSSFNFNQPINNWDVSNVTSMASMFGFAYSFNQDIGSWDIGNVNNFTNFMIGKTDLDYSTTNLDSIYNGWSSLGSVQSGININFGSIKYTAGGSAGKAILTGTYLWTITDGGI
jgi:surface protein